MTMDAKEVGDILAVTGSAACDPLERLQALALLGVVLLFQALAQFLRALCNGRHPFSHLGSPSTAS
jgi:hypothetical protein